MSTAAPLVASPVTMDKIRLAVTSTLFNFPQPSGPRPLSLTWHSDLSGKGSVSKRRSGVSLLSLQGPLLEQAPEPFISGACCIAERKTLSSRGRGG
ncbi:hypothetical protein P691DRAFT_769146 [Macrolepiota fuliginosa MF-IS2]|uniref:Uncharacterized protein n=1 Tax=Macrolepiota fuliginosa MF-IS2 TaxID=1400762 RepID=A0A9P5WXI6_9AGAR|nr:hypothetical protein P691DRAFT_769146 [Macrolepiota fuliginosa MF-IS2]